jgi:hypothetical protein
MNIQKKAIAVITTNLRKIHHPSTPAQVKCIRDVARASWRLDQLAKVEGRLGPACPVLLRDCRLKFETDFARRIKMLKQTKVAA